MHISSSSSSCTARTDFFDSLAIRPYRLSLPTGLLDDIPCPYRAVRGKFLLVGQHWHVQVKGAIRKRYMCSSLLHQQCPAWL